MMITEMGINAIIIDDGNPCGADTILNVMLLVLQKQIHHIALNMPVPPIDKTAFFVMGMVGVVVIQGDILGRRSLESSSKRV